MIQSTRLLAFPNLATSSSVVPSLQCTSKGFSVSFSPASSITQKRGDVIHKSTIQKYLPVILKSAVALDVYVILSNHLLGLGEAATQSTVLTSASQRIGSLMGNLVDLITTLSEPVLWGYAVLGFLIMMNDRNRGVQKIKSVIYASLGIHLLPALFSILHSLSQAVTSSLH